MRSPKSDVLARAFVHATCLLPLAILVWDFSHSQLTANPIEAATHRTGKTALLLLLVSLSCRPAYMMVGLKIALRFRRTLGLYCFFYAALHLLIFVGVDYQLDPSLIREAILEKRYALAGLAAFLLLVPLALTSTLGWVRRLGKDWRRLHRLVYFAAAIAVVHYLWLVKGDVSEPLRYGAILALLLLLRLPAVGGQTGAWYRRLIRQG